MASQPAPVPAAFPAISGVAGLLQSALMAVLALYGLWSIPPLIAMWSWSAVGVVPIAVWLATAGMGWPLLYRAPRRAEWVMLAAVAIALRIGAGMLAAGHVSSGDPYYYPLIARQLLAGQGFFVDEPYMGIRAHAFFPPVYPLLLAGWGAIWGFSTASLVMLHSLTDLVAAALIWRIGAALDRPGAGRAAAWLYLIWPSVLLSDGVAQKESLATALILGLAYVWVRQLSGERRGWGGPLALGVLAALLALTQPGQAALAALFGLVLAGRIGWQGVMGFGLRGLPAAALLMLPWWVRNWLVLGAFVPLTSASGLSLWIGNNPDATGNWMPPPPSLKGMPELASAKHAAMLARDWIAGHPLQFIRLTIAKFFRAVGVGQFGLYRLAIMTPPLAEALVRVLLPLSHLAHVGLLAGGAVATRRRSGEPTTILALLLLACIVQLALFGVWFEFGERHREFMTPFLLLVICAALSPRADPA